MKNTILVLALSVVTVNTYFSQYINWGISTNNVNMDFTFSSSDTKGNIVIGGKAKESNFHKYPSEIYDANGVVHEEGYLANKEVILSYNQKGELNWKFFVDSRAAELKGITHTVNNKLVLLVYVNPTESEKNKDDWYEEEYEENQKDTKPLTEDEVEELEKTVQYYGYIYTDEYNAVKLKAGNTLLYIDDKGKIEKTISITNKYNLGTEVDKHYSINSFDAHPDGDFVISGYIEEGKLAKSFTDSLTNYGGDFILKIDSEGNPVWSDVLVQPYGECAAYLISKSKVSIANNGTIYFGGCYYDSLMELNNNIKLEANQTKTNKGSVIHNSIYIASYKANGELNWLKSPKINVSLDAIETNNKGVVLATRFHYENTFFNKKIDTSENKHTAVIYLSNKGKVKQINSMLTDRIFDLKQTEKGDLLVLGACDSRLGINKIESDTLGKYVNGYLAAYNKKGKYQGLNIIEVPFNNNEPMQIHAREKDVYVSGSMFLGRKFKVKLIDENFVGETVNGGSSGFLVQIKK